MYVVISCVLIILIDNFLDHPT